MRRYFGKKFSQDLIAVSLCFCFAVTLNFGQRPAKPKQKNLELRNLGAGVNPDEFEAEPRISGFGFYVALDASGNATVEIAVNQSSKTVTADDLNNIYERFATFQTVSPSRSAKPAHPVVVVSAAPVIKYGDILKFVEPLRRYGPSRIKLATANGQFIIVPGKSKANLEVKPNPLILIVSVSESFDIHINRESVGAFSDLSILRKRLEEIFKARAANGVFREGTNTIETTVRLRLPALISYDKVLQLNSMIRSAGSDRLLLELDAEDFVDSRKPFITQ